jgi:uncharacterized protein YhbP (UPF0306 family)
MERFIEPSKLKNNFADLLALSTMTLATCGVEGDPHAVDVYFACGEPIILYFFSDASSQHGLDIQHDPRAAITIHAASAGWDQIQGLQMRGRARLYSSQDKWQPAWDVYQRKFPFVTQFAGAVDMSQLYGFIPTWVRLVDNSRGFGFKQEWQVVKPDADRGQVDQWQQIFNHNKGESEPGG